MDITALFRASVEIVRKQTQDVDKILETSPQANSNKNGTIPGKTIATSTSSKSKVFPGKKSEYYAQARDLLTTLTGLQKYLRETRGPYLNIGSHGESNIRTAVFKSSRGENTPAIPEFTNEERDQVDQDVQQIIQNSQKRIFEFQKIIETTSAEQKHPQLFTHLENVSTSLGVYLKEICTFYSEMRAIRVKRTVDFQAMSRLSTTKPSTTSTPYQKKNFERKTEADGDVGDKFSKSGALNSTAKSNSKNSNQTHQGDVEYNMSPSAASYFEDDEELTPEEIQVLEAENAQLYNELNSLSDEVDQIQSSVVQVAQLQTIFTEKILHQHKDIEKITHLVVGATENIKGGNEQIRQAIQQSADFRAWVLFFIIVMSLSVLFLDWYND